jgi:predicted DNA-binding transcriptional regulator AlpA
MTVLLRFRELKARRIVRNRMTLRRRIALDGFPPGRMTGPNERSWTEDEIDAWVKSRPIEGPKLKGAAKRNRDRLRSKSDSAAAAPVGGANLDGSPDP